MKKYFCIICLCLSCNIVGYAQSDPTLFSKVDKVKMNHWVDSVFNSMSEDERIGQLFMFVANPASDNRNMQTLTRYVEELKIGGILFHRGGPVMQAEVTNRLQNKAKVPLFISLDGEWGLSMRLDGTTRFPKNMMLGAIEDNQLIYEYGVEVARQCREMGIQINFAPDIDVNSNTRNPVIGLRSFGEDPDAVAEKGIAYAKGLEDGQVISVAKHFPGHGDTSEDSHHTLPVLYHDLSRLEEVELLPFRRYIYEGMAGIMTAHLHIPALDSTSNRPASLSSAIVTDLLQKKIGFRGLAFTDALAMKGATQKTDDNPSVLALLAGNDILLAPAAPITDYNAVKEAVANKTLDIRDIEAKCIKILQYKYITGLNNYQPINLSGLEGRLNTPHAEWLVSRLNAEALTLLKNDAYSVPVKQLDKKKMAVLSIGSGAGNPFQQMLSRYDAVDHFSIGVNSSAEQVNQVYAALDKYDLIICGVHTERIPESEALRKLASEKELIYSFFTIPYFCRNYKQSIESAKAVIMAYENTSHAQGYAAQLIFGGIPAKGKLSVSIPELYPSGTGVFTRKTRLGYHEAKEVGLNQGRLDMIDKIVEEGLEKKAFPGCQVLVAKDGMIIYNKSFGYLDYEKTAPVTETTVYDIASMTKTTATLLAVMKSYDEKNLSLNNKLIEFIPELSGVDKDNLTMRDLLYHQSGLPPTISFYRSAIDNSSFTGSLFSRHKDAGHPVRYDATTYARNDFSYYPENVSFTKKAGFTTEVAHNFYVHDSFKDTIMQGIKNAKLTTRGRYVYSCVNFILLKMITERLMQTPMDELLEANFYKPLGAQYTMYNPLRRMNVSQIAPTEDDGFVRRQLVRGYVHDESAAFQGGVSGNAGLFSTANDIAKISQMWLDGGVYGEERYLSEVTNQLFTQNKSPNSRRGLGFDKPLMGSPNSSPCGALAPASVYGHTGFTGTCFWVDPDNRLVYVFLSNRVYPNRSNNLMGQLDIRTRIQDAIYRAIDRE